MDWGLFTELHPIQFGLGVAALVNILWVTVNINAEALLTWKYIKEQTQVPPKQLVIVSEDLAGHTGLFFPLVSNCYLSLKESEIYLSLNLTLL